MWYAVAAKTSPDASIPVFLATLKLEVTVFLREMKFFKVSMDVDIPKCFHRSRSTTAFYT